MGNAISKELFARAQTFYIARVNSTLRIAVLTLFSTALVAGCFNPSIKEAGFACSGAQDGQCPSGYFCVNGRCVDSPLGTGVGSGTGGVAAHDMSATDPNSSNDLSMVSVAPMDMAVAAKVDLAQPPVIPPDMAHVPPDMALSTGNSCSHSLCLTGGPLKSSCDPCVATICAKYPNCCTKAWSSLCVGDVNNLCNGAAQCP